MLRVHGVRQPSRAARPAVRLRYSLVAALVCGAAWLAVAVCATAGTLPTTFAAAGCARFGPLVVQSMDGHFSACLQIGPIPAGPRSVVLEQVGAFPGIGAKARRSESRDSRIDREPPVRVSLSPSSGRPGTVVTVTIRVPASFHKRASKLLPNLCWNGCQLGLDYQVVTVKADGSHAFRARMTVPAAPWLQGGPTRIAPLRSGAYAVGVQCMRLVKTCDTLSAEGSATFHLHAAQPAWCPDQPRCASLRVDAVRAMPGDVVRVTGVAPLTGVLGARHGFGGELDLVRPRHGSVVLRGLHRVAVEFGDGRLTVTAPPSFTGLPSTVPLSEVSDGLPLISADALDPATVASCAPGAVELTQTGSSAPPAAIPTAAAGATLAALGYQWASGPPTCNGVALLDTSAGVRDGVVAAFPVLQGAGFFDVPLFTRDGGASWSAPPTPAHASPEGFGGFRYVGGATELVYATNGHAASAPGPAANPNRPVGLVSGDGGASWTAGSLGCPAAGPCVTLSPYSPGLCGLLGSSQSILRSADGGTDFSVAPTFDQVDACGEAELAGTSARDELLIDTASEYPVQQSTDGGATWSDVGLPNAPGENPSRGLGEGVGGLTLLSNGSLLLSGGAGYRGGWELLAHGARNWCAVRSPSPSIQGLHQLSRLTVIGDELWWLTGTPDSTAAPAIERVAVGSVAC